jgi:hypothetical protein
VAKCARLLIYGRALALPYLIMSIPDRVGQGGNLASGARWGGGLEARVSDVLVLPHGFPTLQIIPPKR